jgi:hypothetical protein
MSLLREWNQLHPMNPKEQDSYIYLVMKVVLKHCPFCRIWVLTAVIMKSSTLLDVTPCSPFQDKSRYPCLLPASHWFLAWLALRPWRWRWHVLLKCRLTFDGLHSIILQKTELLIVLLSLQQDDGKFPIYLCIGLITHLCCTSLDISNTLYYSASRQISMWSNTQATAAYSAINIWTC